MSNNLEFEDPIGAVINLITVFNNLHHTDFTTSFSSFSNKGLWESQVCLHRQTSTENCWVSKNWYDLTKTAGKRQCYQQLWNEIKQHDLLSKLEKKIFSTAKNVRSPVEKVVDMKTFDLQKKSIPAPILGSRGKFVLYVDSGNGEEVTGVAISRALQFQIPLYFFSDNKFAINGPKFSTIDKNSQIPAGRAVLMCYGWMDKNIIEFLVSSQKEVYMHSSKDEAKGLMKIADVVVKK